MDREPGTEDDDPRPDFARGRDREDPRTGRKHEGSFATGQEETSHHPEEDLPGRFDRGQSDRRP
jgi:hypothetical protein